MKYMVISDIHGSPIYLRLALDIFNKDKYDKLIVLGDIYYHGPRNPLSEGYNPMEVAAILNDLKDKIIVLKGNCDAEVDQMISEFKFMKSYELKIANKTLYFHHGHKGVPLKNRFDYIFQGHTHIMNCEVLKHTILLNPGSITLPKKGEDRYYILIDDKHISIRNLLTSETVKDIFLV